MLKKEEAWFKSFALGSEYGIALGSEYGLKSFAMLKKYQVVWFADLFWPDEV